MRQTVSSALRGALFAGFAACLLLPGCATDGLTSAERRELDNTFKEHAADAPLPSPAAWTEPAQPVTGAPVVYTTADGQPVTGWLARPANATGDLPGLIVIHQWWGLDDSIRRAAERLAGQGYVALAVDLYNGAVATTPGDAARMSRGVTANKPAGLANIAAAIAFLNAQGVPKTGVIGWCMGGRWSLFTALNFPADIDAAIIYYGGVTDNQTELAVLDMPVLGIFAGDDFIVPPKKAYAFAAAMETLGKDLEFYIYRDAAHAFANPSGTEYNPVAAADAWAKTTAFLDRAL